MAYSATRTDAAMAQAPVSTEVQTLAATGTVSGGQYKLKVDDQTTADLAYNASNATILTALNNLSNVASGDIVLSGGAMPTTPVVMTFAQVFAEENVPLVTVEAGTSPLSGGGSYDVTLTTPGYGAEKNALNAGIDVLGALFDTHAAAFSTVELEACYEHLYKLADMVGNALKDQLT